MGKIEPIWKLLDDFVVEHLENAWRILKGLPYGLDAKYLKYVANLHFPKLGWASSNTHY